MNPDTLFLLANIGVLPFWLLMIFVPRTAWAVRIIKSPWIAIVPAAIYVVLIVTAIAQLGPGLVQSFATLQGVASLLATPQGALIGWVHFLAFDLLVGRWAYLDAHERGISALIMAPVLFFVFMLGPVGFVAVLDRADCSLSQRERVMRVARIQTCFASATSRNWPR